MKNKKTNGESSASWNKSGCETKNAKNCSAKKSSGSHCE